MAAPSNLSRTRMVPNERLDLPDFDSIQDLIDEGVQRNIGALFGPGGGLVSPMTWVLGSGGGNYWLTPTPFQFYWSYREFSNSADATWRGFRGGVGTFNPSDVAQTSAWMFTSVRSSAIAGDAVNSYPFLYVQPKLVQANMEGRRASSGGSETSIATKTRWRAVVDYKWSVKAPTDSTNNGWAPIAVIHSWANGIGVADPGDPSIGLISFWDSPDVNNLANISPADWYHENKLSTMRGIGALQNGADAGSGWNGFHGAAVTNRNFGVLTMMGQLRERFRRHLDYSGGGANHWADDPDRSFFQQSVFNANQEAYLANHLAEVEAAPVLWAYGTFHRDFAPGYTYSLKTAAGIDYTIDPATGPLAYHGASKHIVGITTTAVGRHTIEVTPPPAGYSLASVHVSARRYVGFVAYLTGYPMTDAPTSSKVAVAMDVVSVDVGGVPVSVDPLDPLNFDILVYITKD